MCFVTHGLKITFDTSAIHKNSLSQCCGIESIRACLQSFSPLRLLMKCSNIFPVEKACLVNLFWGFNTSYPYIIVTWTSVFILQADIDRFSTFNKDVGWCAFYTWPQFFSDGRTSCSHCVRLCRWLSEMYGINWLGWTWTACRSLYLGRSFEFGRLHSGNSKFSHSLLIPGY